MTTETRQSSRSDKDFSQRHALGQIAIVTDRENDESRQRCCDAADRYTDVQETKGRKREIREDQQTNIRGKNTETEQGKKQKEGEGRHLHLRLALLLALFYPYPNKHRVNPRESSERRYCGRER